RLKKGIWTRWNVAVMLNSRLRHGDKFKCQHVQPLRNKRSTGPVQGGVRARSLEPEEDVLKVFGSKDAILDKKARPIDLELINASDRIREKDIHALRKETGIPLLVILPIDPRISKTVHSAPFVGVGVQF